MILLDDELDRLILLIHILDLISAGLRNLLPKDANDRVDLRQVGLRALDHLGDQRLDSFVLGINSSIGFWGWLDHVVDCR